MSAWLLVSESSYLGAVHGPSPFQQVPVAQALTRAPDQPRNLAPGRPVRQSIERDDWLYFTLAVPAGARGLDVHLNSISGDADLYVRAEDQPQGSVASGGLFDASSASEGRSVESVRLDDAGDRVWVIAVHGYRGGEFELHADIR